MLKVGEMTLLTDFLKPNPDQAMLFDPWVYIPIHLPMSYPASTHTEPISQVLSFPGFLPLYFPDHIHDICKDYLVTFCVISSSVT